MKPENNLVNSLKYKSNKSLSKSIFQITWSQNNNRLLNRTVKLLYIIYLPTSQVCKLFFYFSLQYFPSLIKRKNSQVNIVRNYNYRILIIILEIPNIVSRNR